MITGDELHHDTTRNNIGAREVRSGTPVRLLSPRVAERTSEWPV